MNIAKRLRQVREYKGLTKTDVANKSGIRFHQYWRYEEGRSTPTTVSLLKIAKALEEPLESLLK